MRTFGWSPSDLELQVKNIFSPFLNGEEKQPLNLVFQELIGEIDQDGNGSISFNEFVWLMTRWTVFRKLTRLKISFVFSGKSKTQRSRTRSGRRSGFSTRRVMGSFARQVILIDIFSFLYENWIYRWQSKIFSCHWAMFSDIDYGRDILHVIHPYVQLVFSRVRKEFRTDGFYVSYINL